MERIRLQLDVSLEAAQRLDALVNLTGSASRAEVIRRALAVYDRVLAVQAGDGELHIVKAGSPDVVLVVL